MPDVINILLNLSFKRFEVLESLLCTYIAKKINGQVLTVQVTCESGDVYLNCQFRIAHRWIGADIENGGLGSLGRTVYQHLIDTAFRQYFRRLRSYIRSRKINSSSYSVSMYDRAG